MNIYCFLHHHVRFSTLNHEIGDEDEECRKTVEMKDEEKKQNVVYGKQQEQQDTRLLKSLQRKLLYAIFI
ncbi:hypothetical protein Bca52824_052863 [Brassica carinata]|uniref:Uncharacterized protein n=1 Tax=Brassica carinata TaxID=52824 RepID=A0A8X7R7Z9_BRACI|nr:hypothetical protein Bca52824_052863 [Brassica carinata]